MGHSKPLAIDLYAGLGGWTEGLLAEGYDVVGFDIERHDYGDGARYPAQLVLQDVMTLHGKQFKDAALIVASPPCQGYSYRAMPWSRAKALPPPDNSLFEACFRIQREACEAAGRYIPLIVENVRGAQKWVGRSRWNYGSYHLWGDVPALMPMTKRLPFKGGDRNIGRANGEHKWNTEFKCNPERDGHSYTRHLTNQSESDAVKGMSGLRGLSHPGGNGKRDMGGPNDPRRFNSHSKGRKAASAAIAKIPFALAQYIAACFKPPACWNCLSDVGLKLCGPHLYCSICLREMRREYDQMEREESC